MHADTAKQLSQQSLIMQSIKEPLSHIHRLIGAATQQGEMMIILPSDYELRSTSNSEFSDIINHLRSEGYKCLFSARNDPPEDPSNNHVLDVNIITVSWS